MAKVLLIDGNGNLTQQVRGHLVNRGYDVLVARKGSEGMAQAIQEKPDVILLDGVLPDATGFQMCNQFRRNAETQSIPIIMLSGIAHYANQQQFALERGANEHVSTYREVVELGEIVDKYIDPSKKPTLKARPLNPPATIEDRIHEALRRIQTSIDDNPEQKSA